MTAVTVLTATPPLADPWHDFDATTLALVELLEERGDDVVVCADVRQLPAALDRAELFIANCSADQYVLAPEFPQFARSLARFVERGGSVLSVHASLLAFQKVPLWGELLGCRWVHPISMHPQKGWALVQIGDAPSSLTEGLEDFSIYDEKYSRLELDDSVEPLLFHTLEGVTHPLLWQRVHGESRVIVDALGHGLDSYDSPEHRLILARSLDWLTH